MFSIKFKNYKQSLVAYILIFSSFNLWANDLHILRKNDIEQQEIETFLNDNELENDADVLQWWLLSDINKKADSISLVEVDNSPVEVKVKDLTSPKGCYLVMVDASKSMTPFWKDASPALQGFFEEVNSSYTGLYTFASNFQELLPLRGNNSPSDAVEKISQITLDGKDTQLYLSTQKAVRKLASCPYQNKYIVVFSDGDAEDKAYTSEEVIILAKENSVSIFTVGFGDLRKQGTALKLEVLKKLSSETYGKAYEYSDQAEYLQSIQALFKQTRPGGFIAFELKTLPYKTKELKLNFNFDDQSNIEKVISVENTDKFDNILVSISKFTGVKNPWHVIYGVLGSIITLVLLWLILHFLSANKRKKKEKYNQEKLSKIQQQQNAQNAKLQQAIDNIEAQVEDNRKTVYEDGRPFAYLERADGKRFELVYCSTTIGRYDDNDVIIDDPHISGHHAVLDFKNSISIWTDRAPLNPSSVNSVTAEGSVAINPNDMIICGKTTFIFVLA